MSLHRRAAKRDTSEKEILQALVRVGADYILLAHFDILVLHRGQIYLLECKTGKGRKTGTQQDLVDRGWPLQFVNSPEQALAAIGVKARG